MKLQTLFLTGITALATSAAGSAQAQERAGAEDEIVVTAERTDRTLRQTASSVVVTTADEVARLGGAYSLDDVVSRTPNLVSTRPASNAPAIRGIDGTGPALGGDAFFGGTRARVNYLIDNRPLSFNETVYIDGLLWDLQQIEVYRGPQSTL